MLQRVLGELLHEATKVVRSRVADWSELDAPDCKLARLVAAAETLSAAYSSPLLLGLLRWRESTAPASDLAAFIVARVAVAILRRAAPHFTLADAVATRLEALAFEQLRGATTAAPPRPPTHGVPFIRNYFASSSTASALAEAAAATSSEHVVSARAALVDVYGRLLTLLAPHRYGQVLRRLWSELSSLSVSSGVLRARAIALVESVRTLALRCDSREHVTQTSEFVQKLVVDVWLPTTRAEVRIAVSDLLLRMTRPLLFPRNDAFADAWTLPPADYADWFALMQSLFERRPKKSKKIDPTMYPVLSTLLCCADRAFFSQQLVPLTDALSKLAREKPTRTLAVACLERLLHTYFARHLDASDPSRITTLYTTVHQAFMHPLTRRFASFPSAVLTRTVAHATAPPPPPSACRDCLSPLTEFLAPFVSIAVILERVRDATTPAAAAAATSSAADASAADSVQWPAVFDVALGDVDGGDVEWLKARAGVGGGADDESVSAPRVPAVPLPLEARKLSSVLPELLHLPEPVKEISHPERLVVGLSAALRLAGWSGDTTQPRVDVAAAQALVKRAPKLQALIWAAFLALDTHLRPLLLTRVNKPLVELLQKSGNLGWLALDALELCMACVPALLCPRDGADVSPDTLAQLLAPYLMHVHRHVRLAASATFDRVVASQPAAAPRFLRSLATFAAAHASDRPTLVDGLLRMLRRLLRLAGAGETAQRLARADIVVVDAVALLFLCSPLPSTRRSALRLSRAVRQVGERLRAPPGRAAQARALYVVDLVEHASGIIVTDACKRTGHAAYLSDLSKSGAPRAEWLTKLLDASDGVSQLVWSHCVASIARLAVDVCAPVAWHAGDFAYQRLTASVVGGELVVSDGEQLLAWRNYASLACATASVRQDSDDVLDAHPSPPGETSAPVSVSQPPTASSSSSPVPSVSASTPTDSETTNAAATPATADASAAPSAGATSEAGADDDAPLPARSWASATLFAALLAQLKASRSAVREAALFALERAADATHAELFECLLALERSYAMSKRGKDKSSKIVLRIAVSRVTAFMCESIRPGALLLDAALRKALMGYVESTTNYLERHTAVLGDGREQLRCNLCVIVRELAKRMHGSARSLLADTNDETDASRPRFTTALVHRLFKLCTQWSRGLLNVVDLRPHLSRTRDVQLIQRFRAVAITLQWVASGAIGALLRQPLPSAQISDPQSLAHDAFEWIEALLHHNVLDHGAAVAADRRDNAASGRADDSGAATSSDAATPPGGASAASASDAAAPSAKSDGKKGEQKRDFRKSVSLAKSLEMSTSGAGGAGGAGSGSVPSLTAAGNDADDADADKDAAKTDSGGGASTLPAPMSGGAGVGAGGALPAGGSDEPETLDQVLAASAAASSGKVRKELGSVGAGGDAAGAGGDAATSSSAAIAATAASTGGSGSSGSGAGGSTANLAGASAGAAGAGAGASAGAGAGASGAGVGALNASDGTDALFSTHLGVGDSRRLTATVRLALENLLLANHSRSSIVAAVIDRCYASEPRGARAHAAALCAVFRQSDPLQSVGIVDLLVLLMFLAGHTDRALRHIADEMVQLVESAAFARPSAGEARPARQLHRRSLSDDGDDASIGRGDSQGDDISDARLLRTAVLHSLNKSDDAVGAYDDDGEGEGDDATPASSLLFELSAPLTSAVDSDLDVTFERAQLALARQLASVHRARASIIVVTLARRMHTQRSDTRRRLLLCMQPFLGHVELAIAPEYTRLLDSLLWVICRYPTEHWDPVSALWQTLCTAHTTNVALLANYLLARVTERRSVALVTIVKRLLVAMARSAPAAVVGAVVGELLSSAEPVAPAATPVSPRAVADIAAVADEAAAVAAAAAADEAKEASPSDGRPTAPAAATTASRTSSSKKLTLRDGKLRRAIALATRKSPPTTPSVSPPHTPPRSPVVSPRNTLRAVPPMPADVLSELSPYSGGYPDRSLERALLILLPQHRGPLPLARGHVALVVATELAQWHAAHMREHLAQVLHHVCLALDHSHALVLAHARRLLLLLLHALVVVPSLRHRVPPAELSAVAAAQRLRERLTARAERALCDGESAADELATLTRDVAAAFACVAAAPAAAPADWLRAQLTHEALLWAIGCPQQQLACRSHAMFRALAQTVAPDDVSRLLAALRRAVAASSSTLVLETLASLQAALQCMPARDLLLVPHALWALVAMLNSTHSATYARTASALAWLVGRLELANRAAMSVLLSTVPLSWTLDASPTAFFGIQPLAVRGVLRSATERASLQLLLCLLDVQHDALVQRDAESRLLVAFAGMLPAIVTNRLRALRSLEPLWLGEPTAALLAARLVAACRARRCVGTARALERLDSAAVPSDAVGHVCTALLDEFVGASFNRLMFTLSFFFQMLDEGSSNHHEALFVILLPLLAAIDLSHDAFAPHLPGWFVLAARHVDGEHGTGAARLLNELAARSSLSTKQPELAQLRAAAASMTSASAAAATLAADAGATRPLPAAKLLGEVVEAVDLLMPRASRVDISPSFFAKFLAQPPPASVAAPPPLAAAPAPVVAAQAPASGGAFVSAVTLPSPGTSVGSVLNAMQLRDSVGLDDSSAGGGDDGDDDDGEVSAMSDQLHSAVIDDDDGTDSDDTAHTDRPFEGVFHVDDLDEHSAASDAAPASSTTSVAGDVSDGVDPESTASKRARHARSRARARRSRSSFSASATSTVSSTLASIDDDVSATDSSVDDSSRSAEFGFRRRVPSNALADTMSADVGSELWDILSPTQSRRRPPRVVSSDTTPPVAVPQAAPAPMMDDDDATTPTPSYHEVVIAERLKGPARQFSHFAPFEGFDEILADLETEEKQRHDKCEE